MVHMHSEGYPPFGSSRSCFLTGIALFVFVAGAVRGQYMAPIAYEPFNYTAGSGFSGVTTNATGFSGTINFLYEFSFVSTIASGSLNYTDSNSASLVTSGNRYIHGHGALFENFDTSGGGPFGSYLRGSAIGLGGTTLYMGLELQIVSPGGFAGFALSRGGTNDANRVVSLDIWTNHSTGDYFLTTWAATNVPVQQADLGFVNSNVNFFVLKFDFGTGGTDTLSIYANPLLNSALGTPTAVVTGSDLSFDRFDVRDFGAFSIAADEIRVGTSYASVTGVPESSTWAAIAGALALGCAFWRRRFHGRAGMESSG